MHTKKIKILLVGSVPPPYHGSNIYFEQVMNRLSSNEFCILYINTSDKRKNNRNIGNFDIVNIFYGLKNIFDLIYNCIRNEPDIIYLNTSQSYVYIREGLFIIFSKIFSRAKIVQHLHGSNFLNFYNQSNLIFKKFINYTQKKVDYSIVLSEQLKYNFLKWARNKKIFSLPNGIEVKNKLKYNKQNRFPKLYFFSNIKIFKGILIALDVIKILKIQYPEIELNIIGEWSNDSFYGYTAARVKEIVNKYILDNEISENVIYHGLKLNNEKYSLLSEFDIHLHPTYNDGFPLTVLESMLIGNVVITSKNVGALNDIILNNVNGFLVEKGNSGEIAQIVSDLILNYDERIRIGLNAKERCLKYYTIENNIVGLSKIFKDIYKE